MYIDYNALEIAQKVLVIISILLICVANFILITKQVRKRLFYHSPKLMTVISLAIGDIFHALFPLVIQARIFFDYSYQYLSCSTQQSYTTYQNFMLHFVYGFGLIVLMSDAVYRRHPPPTHANFCLRAVLTSSLPWILGLVVVLPLCMSRVNYSYQCVNDQSIEAMYAVSVFLPASLAVFVAIVLNCVKKPGLHQQGQAPAFNQQPVIYYNPNSNLHTGNSFAPSLNYSRNFPNQQGVLHLTSQPNIYQFNTSQPNAIPSNAAQPNTNQQFSSQYCIVQPSTNYYGTFFNGAHQFADNKQLATYNDSPKNVPSHSQYLDQQGVYYTSSLPNTNQYINSQPSNNQYSTIQPSAKQYSTNQQSANQYSNNHQSAKQDSTNQPSANQDSTNQPRANQYNTNQPRANQYNTNQPSANQYSTSQPSANQYSTEQYGISQQVVPLINAPVNTVHVTGLNPQSELKKLTTITALFFIMVVPLASLVLAIKDNTWTDNAVTVISQVFFWLMVARSYVTPVLMMSYADL